MAKSKPHEVRPFLTSDLASAKAQEKLATLRKYYELEFCKAWKDSVKIGEVDSFSPHFRRAQLDCGA